ncbi:MAG: hypothetical protein KGD61_07470 [Candidatus Lokiarchaeota archaeon]|nr:hypothetical protein [Candidatus Lokiarchaeota archaeon]
MSSFIIFNSSNNVEKDTDFNNLSRPPSLANTVPAIFEGNEVSLNITDYGNLYETNQEVSLNNQEELNLNYYLDAVHDWKVSKVETQINNIQDTREWVQNNDFTENDIYKVDVSLSNIWDTSPTRHNYTEDLNPDPSNPSNIHNNILQNNASLIRVHFDRFEIEEDWDVVCFYDENDILQYVDTGKKASFFSPWIKTTHIKITMDSDSLYQWWGYDIDYYEYVYDGVEYYDSFDHWGYDNAIIGGNFGSANMGNETAMYVSLVGEPDRDTTVSATYYNNDFSEIYQNITIPRGQIVDGYISFDYYAEFAMDSNENSMYCEINNQKIYSKGIGAIVGDGSGRRIWKNTGEIHLALWSNTSNLFEDIQYNQEFNISVGVMSGGTITYSGFNERFQQIFWFDNLSLVLTTLANSSQSDINLTLNGDPLDEGDQWGKSELNITGSWGSNPVVLTVNTSSPSLSFELDTVLYGYHETTSLVDRTTLEGVSYEILENGSVYWYFSHNFFKTVPYSEFEFIIEKPLNWEFLYALDQYLIPYPFEYGNIGDSILKVNKSNDLLNGWWTFKATSPNYLDIVNTKMFKQGEWTHTSFDTGESTRIKTQVNFSSEIPNNIQSTEVNLTIFDPDGNQWYSEVNSPLSNGTVFFSEINFSALNTTGGQFDYSLFWSNGTALGGVKSNFVVNHQSQIKLLKPDDAKIDLRTDGFVGDIIPVRIILTDPENNLSISDAVVSYNWTGGSTLNFTEAAIGVYETIFDTADLSSRGLYKILISSSKLGFVESNITLEINLGEETNLQRLESEYNIELHANSTIKFKFTDFSGDGIDGATVNISINDPSNYSIDNLGNGTYDIEFSTSYIDYIGIYQINFTFSATGYEPQYYVYQFQIIEQSVNLSVFINSVKIQENSLHEITFFDIINVSAKAMSIIDEEDISGGNFTWISATFEKNLTEFAGDWYNSSIECLPEYFSSGINFIYLKFEHPNYRTQTFGFEILIDRIEFDVDIVGHEDSNPTIKAEIGGLLTLQIELLDIETNQTIENATVLYEWTYGVGQLQEVAPGTYQLTVGLPENLQGNFIFNLIISKEGTVYKTTQSSFLLVIGEPQFPTFLIWLIIIISALIISALGVMSLRSYVILPRRRRREAELLTRTQRFKDMQNIQAIVAIHRDSGIPLYTKSYSILEKHKKEIFSGFIQAIITVGEEMVGRRGKSGELVELDGEDGSRTILELDFKYFYCLICDRQDLRIIFILTEKASDRMKKMISDLSLGSMLELSEQIGNWDGAIHEFETKFPPIINSYVELYFKEAFTINNAEQISKVRKEGDLNSMETRILNTIYSISKGKQEFYLNTIFELIHEKNEDIVIDAIETLIKKQVIIPSTK